MKVHLNFDASDSMFEKATLEILERKIKDIVNQEFDTKLKQTVERIVDRRLSDLTSNVWSRKELGKTAYERIDSAAADALAQEAIKAQIDAAVEKSITKIFGESIKTIFTDIAARIGESK